MVSSKPEKGDDGLRHDLVAYLAQRLGTSHEMALRTLGDWLVDFKPRHAARDHVAQHVPPDGGGDDSE